jgi:hypothetical protein
MRDREYLSQSSRSLVALRYADLGGIILEDVNVQVSNVEHGVATLLFVTAGLLDFLEFATFTGSWPKDPQLLALGYYRAKPSERGSFTMIQRSTMV